MAGEIPMENICLFIIRNNSLPLNFFRSFASWLFVTKFLSPTESGMCWQTERCPGPKMKSKSLGTKFYVFVLKLLCLLSHILSFKVKTDMYMELRRFRDWFRDGFTLTDAFKDHFNVLPSPHSKSSRGSSKGWFLRICMRITNSKLFSILVEILCITLD